VKYVRTRGRRWSCDEEVGVGEMMVGIVVVVVMAATSLDNSVMVRGLMWIWACKNMFYSTWSSQV
jgi:hypothetical protein